MADGDGSVDYEPDFEPATPSTIHGGEEPSPSHDAELGIRDGSIIRSARPTSAVSEVIENMPYETTSPEPHPLSRGISRKAPGHLTESSRRRNLPVPPSSQQPAPGPGLGQRPASQNNQFLQQQQQQLYQQDQFYHQQGVLPIQSKHGWPDQEPDSLQHTARRLQFPPEADPTAAPPAYLSDTSLRMQQTQLKQAQAQLPADYPHPQPPEPQEPRWPPNREGSAAGAAPHYPLKSQLSGRRLSARSIASHLESSSFDGGLQARLPAVYPPSVDSSAPTGPALPLSSGAQGSYSGRPGLQDDSSPEGDIEGAREPSLQGDERQQQRFPYQQGHDQGRGRPQSHRRLPSSEVQPLGQQHRQSHSEGQERPQEEAQPQQEEQPWQRSPQPNWGQQQAQEPWSQQPQAPNKAGLGSDTLGRSSAWAVSHSGVGLGEVLKGAEEGEDVASEPGREVAAAVKPHEGACPQPPPAANARRGSRLPELDLSASHSYDAGVSGDVTSPAMAAAVTALPSVRSSGGAGRSFRSLPSASSLPSLSGAAGGGPPSVRYADVFRTYDKDNDDRIDSGTMVAAFEELGLLAGAQVRQLGELLGLPADWVSRKRLYAPHEFIAFCEKLASSQAKAAREERIRNASRLPGVPPGAERSKLLRRLYTRYAVAAGEGRLLSEDDFAEPRLTGSQLQRLVTDMGLMQPAGPMTAVSVGVVFAKCKPPGTRKLNFHNFLRALAAMEEECAGMADVWLITHGFALKTKQKRSSGTSPQPLQRGQIPGRFRSNKVISISGEPDASHTSIGYFSDQDSGSRLPRLAAPPPLPVAVGSGAGGSSGGGAGAGPGFVPGALGSPRPRASATAILSSASAAPLSKYPYERKFSEPTLPSGRGLNIKVAASFPAPGATRSHMDFGMPNAAAAAGAGSSGGALPGVLAPLPPPPRQAFAAPSPAPVNAPDGNLLSDPLLASARPKPQAHRSLTGIATLPQGYAILASQASAPHPVDVGAVPAGSGTPGTSASASTHTSLPGGGGGLASESSLQALVQRVATLEVQSQEHRARHAELRLEVFQRMSDLAAVTAGSPGEPADRRSDPTAADAAQVAVTASGTAHRASENAAAARYAAEQAAALAAQANEGVEALEERMDALEERVESCEESMDASAVEAKRASRLEEELRGQREALEACRDELSKLQTSVASDLTQLSESVVAMIATSVTGQLEEELEQRLREVEQQLEQRLMSRLTADLEAQVEQRLRERLLLQHPHPAPPPLGTLADTAPRQALSCNDEDAAVQSRELKSRGEQFQSMSGGNPEEHEQQRRRVEALEAALKAAEGGAAAARVAAEAAEARIVAMQAMQTALDTAAAAAATPALLVPSQLARRTTGSGESDILTWLETRVAQLAVAAEAHAVQLKKLNAVQEQMQAATTTTVAASTAAAVAASEQRIAVAAATAAAALSAASRAAEVAEEAHRKAEDAAMTAAAAERAVQAVAAPAGAGVSPAYLAPATQDREPAQEAATGSGTVMVGGEDAASISAARAVAAAEREGGRAPSAGSSSGVDRQWGEQMRAYLANQINKAHTGGPGVADASVGGAGAALQHASPTAAGVAGGRYGTSADVAAVATAATAAQEQQQQLAELSIRIAACEAVSANDARTLSMHQSVLDEHADELRLLSAALQQQQQQQPAAAEEGLNGAGAAAAAAPPPHPTPPAGALHDPKVAAPVMARLEEHLSDANEHFQQLQSDIKQLAMKVSELEMKHADQQRDKAGSSTEGGGGQWPRPPGTAAAGGDAPPGSRPSSAFGNAELGLGPRPGRRSGTANVQSRPPETGGASGPTPGPEPSLHEVNAKADEALRRCSALDHRMVRLSQKPGRDGGVGDTGDGGAFDDDAAGGRGSTGRPGSSEPKDEGDEAPVNVQALVNDLERRLREDLDQALQELLHQARLLEELQSRMVLLEKAHLEAAAPGSVATKKDLEDLQAFTHTAMEEISVSVRRLEGLTTDLGTDMQYAAKDVGRMLVQVRHLQELYGELAEAAGLSRPQGSHASKSEAKEAVPAA